MNFARLIKRIKDTYPDKVAVIDKGEEFSYRNLWKKLNCAGGFLTQSGVKKGDRVLLLLPNSITLLALHYGAIKIGVISIPVKAEYKIWEVTKIIRNCNPRLLISCDHWLEANPGIYQEIDSARILSIDTFCIEKFSEQELILPVKKGEIATINYTYFGDDYPKGAALTHANHIYAAIGYSRFQSFDAKDIFLIILPIPHVYTLSGCINSAFITGGTIVILNQLSPKAIYAAIANNKVTIFSAVPAIYDYLVSYKKREMYDISSLRLCVTGGDYMPKTVQEEFERKLKTQIVQGYGLTECLPIICNPPNNRNKRGTLGIPGRRDIAIKIIGGNKKELPNNQIGEIVIKGTTTMSHYYNLPEDTEKVLINGWLHTGDLGKVDEDGYLYFVGLKKDIINIYGNNVAPLEVQKVIIAHPAVKNARVYKETTNKNSSLSLQRICADVFLQNGCHIAVSEIRSFCRSKIASYKIPERIRIK